MNEEQWEEMKVRIDRLIEEHGPSDAGFWNVLAKEILPMVRRDNDRLRAALRWYADRSNYASIGGPSPIQLDSGIRAQQALFDTE